MRGMDIPARIVTGYQGGEINGVDGFWTIRQSDAHAWAEVWLAGQGWVRVDPTSAVAPGRTGSFQRLAAPRGVVMQAFGTLSPTLSAELRAVWEAVNNSWNQRVLNYTQGKQLNLLENIGFDSPSLAKVGIASDAASTPRQLARQVLAHHPDQGQALHDWLMQLEQQRYAAPAAATRQPLQALKLQLRQLRWPT